MYCCTNYQHLYTSYAVMDAKRNTDPIFERYRRFQLIQTQATTFNKCLNQI